MDKRSGWSFEEDPMEEMEDLAEASIENLAQHFFDSYERENAAFRRSSGLKVTVIREELGDCCSWCADLAGVYEYGSEPKDVWGRHAHCRCMVVTRTERGTYQDAWSRKEYQSQREARIDREKELLQDLEGEYHGIPRQWTKNAGTFSGDELLKGTNPGYNNTESQTISRERSDYNKNCANCVPAYEMRCRGYNVVARPFSKNKSLARDPFLAWDNAKPLIAESVESMISYVETLDEGARLQVATEFAYTIWEQRAGHTFVAEKINGKCIFKDPQAGVIITDNGRYFDGVSRVRYLRIDNLEISDRGINACEVVQS